MAQPTGIGSGTIPWRSSTVRVLLLKRLGALQNRAGALSCNDPAWNDTRWLLRRKIVRSLLKICGGGGGGGGSVPGIPQQFGLDIPIWPGAIIVQWFPAPNPAADYVEVWRSVNGAASALIGIVPGNVLIYVDNTVFADSDLVCYKARACNAKGCSTFSVVKCEQNGNPV